MKQLLQTMFDSLSRTSIEYQAEAALPNASAENRVILEAIIAADSLDDMHALIADALGNPQAAQAIRDSRTTRLASRKAPSTAVRDFWTIIFTEDIKATA